MTDQRIENLNVYSEDSLITPAQLKAEHPMTERAIETVMLGQRTIKNILDRTDPRLFVVVGPCSIHDVQLAKDYAAKLKILAEELQDTLYLVMRVYFEKPRTTVGWQGLINDPDLDGSCRIEEGLRIARRLLIDIAEIGLPSAGEALDLVTPQYVQDLFSWTAIGARTTEAQTHRRMASALSSAVGFKNATNGELKVAINAMLAAAHPNNFLSINPDGNVAVIRTRGNRYTHVVMRGGTHPNYDSESIAACEEKLHAAKLPLNVMVDCSHGNSQKNPSRQVDVLHDITEQLAQGNQSITSLMIESNLNWGNQPIPEDLAELKYGVSITDGCVDWATTESALRTLRDRVKDILPSRQVVS